MFIAAIPVDAVTEMIRRARTAQRMTSLIRTDFPVPAGPVKKTFSPRATLSNTSCCSGESCNGGGSDGSSTALICDEVITLD
ncbi:hypothetical protein BJ322DRAFT_1057548, partial [Thelephora terrestris]